MNGGIRKPVGLCLGMLTVDRLMNLRQRLEKGEVSDKMFLAIIEVLESIVEDHLCFKQGVENRLNAEDRLRKDKPEYKHIPYGVEISDGKVVWLGGGGDEEAENGR